MPAPEGAQAAAQGDQQGSKTTYENAGQGFVTGNLTKDPDLRFTPSGHAVANIRVAETPRVQDPDTGQWGDGDTSYYDVTVWGEQATRAVEALARGDRIVAAGEWQRQRWTTPEGDQRAKMVLVARDVGPSMLFRQVRVKRDPGKGPKTQ